MPSNFLILIHPNSDFAEALRVTAKAKARFPENLDDLYNRGSKLIRESIECGVTSMRTHVEVDKTVKLTCLDVGLRLVEQWKDLCEIQVTGKRGSKFKGCIV